MKRPPRLATFLLTLVLNAHDRRYALSDLAEEHAALVESRGRASADRWYWHQTIHSLAPSLRRRIPRHGPRPGHLRRGSVGVRAEGMVRDMRYAGRSLLRTPGFTLVAVVTLALGIGANSALFSVVNSVLLSPLPYDNPQQLVAVWENRGDPQATQGPVSLGNYHELLSRSTLFQDMAAVQRRPYNLTEAGDPVRLNGLHATASLFRLLGVIPTLGRGFHPDEELPGAEPVCVISDGLWRTQLGGHLDVVGRPLVLDGRSHTIVGVAPAGFVVPGVGAQAVFTPPVFDEADPNYRGNHNHIVYGRLREGVSVEQANQELASLALALERDFAEWNDGVGLHVRPLRDQLVQGIRRTVLVLFATVGCVLLIACANVATLTLARASGREPEMAIRTALGARSGRLIRHVLLEALLVSAGGALLGLGLCLAAVRALVLWGPSGFPRLAELAVDSRVLVFTLVVAVATGLAFGLAPALQSAKVNLQDALKQGGRLAGPGRRRRVQNALVVAEVALAVVLLIGSGLLLRSMVSLLSVDPGFRPDDRIAMRVSLPASRYEDRRRVTAFLSQALSAIEDLPSVHAAGASIALPLQPLFWRKWVTIEEEPAQALPDVPVTDLTIATPSYLETLRIPLLYGRPLTDRDAWEAPFVALVSQSFVETHFPDTDPIGHRIRLGPPDHLLTPDMGTVPPWYTIVGVVADVRRRGLAVAAQPEVFIAQRQDMDGAREFYIVAHSTSPPAVIAPELRRAVWSADPSQPIAWIQTLDDMLGQSLSQPRLNLLVVGAFGLTALILATMGIYGLLARSVSARIQEIGIRLALGARPADVVGRVVGDGLRVAAAGVAAGLLMSFWVTHLMANMLFEVSPNDVVSFSAVALLLLAVAATAALVPARRAARLHPTEALRVE